MIKQLEELSILHVCEIIKFHILKCGNIKTQKLCVVSPLRLIVWMFVTEKH